LVLVTAIAFSLNARAGMSSLSDGGTETTGLLTTRPRGQRTEVRSQRTEDRGHGMPSKLGKKTELRTSNFQIFLEKGVMGPLSSAEWGMGIWADKVGDKVGDKVNFPTFKCGVGSAECGVVGKRRMENGERRMGNRGRQSEYLSLRPPHSRISPLDY
jgi:hypothetical protein